ncbi:MAG: formate dehydrogenase, beta subunit (F420) [Promethearchaeota archaeon CR_4]|nr:MAG: formate dehydrogenase, beta subunit (F420) [Candidatus Lokiarchaeota archaeon CR_4]
MTKLMEGIILSKEFPKILQSLFSSGEVKALVSSQMKKDRFTLVPTIITDVKKLTDFPLTSYIAYGYDSTDTPAGVVHRKLNGARDQRVAFIGRQEDQFALVELSKRKQVNLANIVSIIIQGMGTINPKKLLRYLKQQKLEVSNITGEYLTPEELILYNSQKRLVIPFDSTIRKDDCFITHRDLQYDILISLVGLPEDGSKVYIAAGTPLGEKIIKESRANLGTLPKDYLDRKENLLQKTWDLMDAQVGELVAEWNKLTPIEKVKGLTKCTACGLCITVCPVCFCKDCNLKAQRKEKVIDSVTYQLSRLAHIGDSCVGCGRCNAICPVGVPLTLYLTNIRRGVKNALEYDAGLDIEIPSPRSKKSVCNH